MGAFTRAGLDIASTVWGRTDFVDLQHWSDTKRLTYEMLVALHEAKLIGDAARDEQLPPLYHHWQLPMYRAEARHAA
jgi:hypothetical protein